MTAVSIDQVLKLCLHMTMTAIKLKEGEYISEFHERVKFLGYLHLYYCPNHCCYYHDSVLVSSGLHQLHVDWSNLQGFSS